jgi:hypothetical protein
MITDRKAAHLPPPGDSIPTCAGGLPDRQEPAADPSARVCHDTDPGDRTRVCPDAVTDRTGPGEPNGEPMTADTEPHQATVGNYCCWSMTYRALPAIVQRRRCCALQARGHWFEPSCAHQPEHPDRDHETGPACHSPNTRHGLTSVQSACNRPGGANSQGDSPRPARSGNGSRHASGNAGGLPRTRRRSIHASRAIRRSVPVAWQRPGEIIASWPVLCPPGRSKNHGQHRGDRRD